LFTSIAQELHSQITMNERMNTTQIYQFQLAIIAHRTTQVIHQLVNTIILKWVAAVICRHTTHSADENSKRGSSFQLKAIA